MVVNIPIYSRDGSSMMVNIPKYKSKQATPSKSVKFAVNGVWFAVSAVGFAAKRRLRRKKIRPNPSNLPSAASHLPCAASTRATVLRVAKVNVLFV